MAASSSLPLAVIFLLVASAVPATAGGGEYRGARMVIIRGSGTRVVGGGAAARAQSNKWRQHNRRLVEDEVVPDLGGMLLGGREGGIAYGALDKDRPGCHSGNQCAAKGPGGSYTRGCTYESRCPHTPAGRRCQLTNR